MWLIIYKKQSGTPSVYYGEAVEEALCYGWIDSKANKHDKVSYFQFFARRNPKSKWSRVNKKKVDQLLKEGKMASAGLEMIEIAKKNGSWIALDEVEELIVPADLLNKLNDNPTAKAYFEVFPRSVKRSILEWILNAKQAQTRSKRIEETISLAAKNERANQYRQKKTE